MTLRLPPQALDTELVFSFFWKFSVFECALKREGFLKSGRKNAAEPDWDEFGRKVHGQFAQVSVIGFKDAVEELMRLSPQRQVVCNGQLRWDAVLRQKDDSEEVFLLRLLKASRNNLFQISLMFRVTLR